MKWLFSRLGYLWEALTYKERRSRPQQQASSPTAPASAPSQPKPPTATVPEKQHPPRPQSADMRPIRRYQRTLVVGVDFGTSSTKVVWQNLSENYFELFRWQPDLRGLESVLLPSTVCVRAGTLVFGDSAPADGDVW